MCVSLFKTLGTTKVLTLPLSGRCLLYHYFMIPLYQWVFVLMEPSCLPRKEKVVKYIKCVFFIVMTWLFHTRSLFLGLMLWLWHQIITVLSEYRSILLKSNWYTFSENSDINDIRYICSYSIFNRNILGLFLFWMR